MKSFRLGMIALLWALTAFTAEAGHEITGKFSNEAGSRSYLAFIPSKITPNSGLVMMLHGCFMTGDQMAKGTHLNELAEKRGFVVVYPEQTYGNNSWKCWNWFRPENQQRVSGETSLLVGMAREISTKYQLNSEKIFAAGLSAGSAMAANLIACYSDVFSGGLLASGLEYGAARSEQEAHLVIRNGSSRNLDESVEDALRCSSIRKVPLRIIITQGSADPFVNPVNADRTYSFFNKLNEKFFIAGGGNSKSIISRETRLPEQAGKYSGTVAETFFGSEEGVKKIVLQKMGHGWSGGSLVAPYMEPRGIDASELIASELMR